MADSLVQTILDGDYAELKDVMEKVVAKKLHNRIMTEKTRVLAAVNHLPLNKMMEIMSGALNEGAGESQYKVVKGEDYKGVPLMSNGSKYTFGKDSGAIFNTASGARKDMAKVYAKWIKLGSPDTFPKWFSENEYELDEVGHSG